jgi:HEPN domain-containing protein
MRKQTKAWLLRAEEDLYVLSVIDLAYAPNHAAVLTQQILEKLLKAIWIELEMYPPMTHDLIALWETVEPQVRLNLDPTMLAVITPYGTTGRYPRRSISTAEAKEATRFCLEISVLLKNWLELRPA